MSETALKRLEKLHRLNVDDKWVNKDLYRLLSKPETLVIAYELIKSNAGNMTAGPDGETLDGVSIDFIRRLSDSLKDESFRFSPTRRVAIPKKSGGTRPLGVPSPRDKIVQKAMLMILESIYDSHISPTFRKSSHGFRAGKSCHTALDKIYREWTGVTWAVEGDIKGYFDNIDHNILVDILRKRIKDERFLNLIWKALRAGYVLEGDFHPTNIGTPQGSIISPILANIFLHEFDLKVEEWQKELFSGSKRRANLEWRSLNGKAKRRIEKLGFVDETAKELLKTARTMPTVDVNDPNYIRVKYVRYADDWILGIIGPKFIAEELKAKATVFLREELKLTLSQEKTKVTNLNSDSAKFLGTVLRLRTSADFVHKIEHSGKSIKRRAVARRMTLECPVREVVQSLMEKGFCKPNGNSGVMPISKGAWINLDPEQIIEAYNSIKRGIFNYYSFVYNRSALQYVDYILRYSLGKTLAGKYRTSLRYQFKTRGYQLKVVREVNGETKTYRFWSPENQFKRTYAFSGGKPLELEALMARYTKARTRTKLGFSCCICKSPEQVEMHHVKHVRKGTAEIKSMLTRAMSSINRKQIPVCAKCHDEIHAGKYDGPALVSFAYNPKYL